MTERITFTGPIDTEGGRQDAQEVELYTGESYDVSASTQTQSEAPPTSESDDTVLSPLQGTREYSLSGLTSVQTISEGFPSLDRKESLRRWLYSLEALVLPQQGLGYEVGDFLRGEDIVPSVDDEQGILVQQVRWTLDSVDIERAEWEIDFQIAEGIQEPSLTPERYIDRQDSLSATIDGIEANGQFVTFEEISTRRVTRSIDLNAVDLMYGTDVPQSGVFDSGVQEEIQFDGRVRECNESLRKEKATFIDTELHGKTAVIYDSFTDRTYEGAVNASTTSFEKGKPNSFEFRTTLEVGDNLTDFSG